jgi:hypothetical protein
VSLLLFLAKCCPSLQTSDAAPRKYLHLVMECFVTYSGLYWAEEVVSRLKLQI